MHGFDFRLGGEALTALPGRALWMPARRVLAVSDLHLGKSERMARVGGRLAPPYETAETLDRLRALVEALAPKTVVSLGDSFDDGAAAEALPEDASLTLSRLMAGRRWIWIAGNHDPAPTRFGGDHRAEHAEGRLTFRHIARPEADCEISGHYHPKSNFHGRRPSFLVDGRRAILPAFGAYTGGLDVASPVFDPLVGPDALVLMTGARVTPAPRAALVRRARRRAFAAGG